MVFFYLVTTGWIFDIILFENSINVLTTITGTNVVVAPVVQYNNIHH